jgi:hypothetical protein
MPETKKEVDLRVDHLGQLLLLQEVLLLDLLEPQDLHCLIYQIQYVEAVFALGQSHRTVCSSAQEHVANGVLVDFDVLAQSVDLVVVCQYSMLDLALLPYALGLRSVLLQVCLAGIRHLPAEDGQPLNSIDQVDSEELVVDGGLAALVPLQIGKITRIGG